LANRPEKEKRKNDRVRLSKAEKIAIPIILIVAVWVVYSVVQPSPPATQPTVSSTAPSTSVAPDFTLPVVAANGLTGQSISLSSFRGKVVFLEFMEPWCPHCQNIAPTLEQLHNKYGDKVVFLSVAGPWQGASASDAAAFITKYGTSWTYVYDSSGTVMSNMYGVTSTPTFFIIGKDGSVLTSCTLGESCGPQLDTDLAQYTG